MLKQLITILFIISSTTLFGQETYKKESQPYIEVDGTAQLEVIPDEIFIKININERYSRKVKITIMEQESNMMAALNDLRIPPSNLSLSDANADYVKVKWRTKEVLTEKKYILKVSNAEVLGRVFKKLDSLEITDANIRSVQHSKIDSIKKSVKIMAIKAAKDKADYLLLAIGEEVGKPLIVKENNFSTQHMGANLNIGGGRKDETLYLIDGIPIRGRQPFDLQFQKIKVMSSIYVKFLIK